MEDDIRQKLTSDSDNLDEQVEELFAHGKVIKPHMDSMGEYLAKKLGVEYVSADLKGEKRAKEKIMSDYLGDASRLTDVTRCSFVCDTYEKMIEVSNALKEALEVKKEKNTMDNPKIDGMGYRDMNQVTKFGSNLDEEQMGCRELDLVVGIKGHLSEVQIQLRPIYEVKNGQGHELYEAYREIEARAVIENRELTEEEDSELEALEEKSIKLYDGALEKYNETTTGKKIKLYREVFKNEETTVSQTPIEKKETDPRVQNIMDQLDAIRPKETTIKPEQQETPKVNKPKNPGMGM